jgi:hypothetical protein
MGSLAGDLPLRYLRAVTVPAIEVDATERERWARLPDPVPLYRTRADEPFWFQVIGEGKVLYLKYNQCRHIRRFGRFAREVLRRLDEGGIERMVIDFRGPNSALAVTYATRFVASAPELGDTPSLEPDVRIQASASEWLAGRDPVLDYAISPLYPT